MHLRAMRPNFGLALRRGGISSVIPSLEDKLPAIESALALDGALLLMVRISDRAMAFSIVVPHVDVLEVLYLAVDPEAWGTGRADRNGATSCPNEGSFHGTLQRTRLVA
ncbi:hypothetical protein SAMN04487916_11167 [Arthrobacter sp. ov407]|uniref:hypothetical protein n=1 Tax=Arthrobacter sp. ov407 TaxID=1761748 RepID=UPI0008924FAF|nr:hypothetical protein [Arthrobacter sp. ov407]SDL60360.1 hypothetical protein SAMN04487916_11167 [Arthrobacter sp. ov407]